MSPSNCRENSPGNEVKDCAAKRSNRKAAEAGEIKVNELPKCGRGGMIAMMVMLCNWISETSTIDASEIRTRSQYYSRGFLPVKGSRGLKLSTHTNSRVSCSAEMIPSPPLDRNHTLKESYYQTRRSAIHQPMESA